MIYAKFLLQDATHTAKANTYVRDIHECYLALPGLSFLSVKWG